MSFKVGEGETEIEAENADARGRIAVLEKKVDQHSRVIAMLHNKVTQLSTNFGRLVSEVSALRSAAAVIQTLSEEVSVLQAQIGQKMKNPVVEQLSTDFIELRKVILAQKARIAAMSSTVAPSRNQRPPPFPGLSRPSPQQPSVPSFDARMISRFPEIFTEFHGRPLLFNFS
jgi:chromosome segregation ATPase